MIDDAMLIFFLIVMIQNNPICQLRAVPSPSALIIRIVPKQSFSLGNRSPTAESRKKRPNMWLGVLGGDKKT